MNDRDRVTAILTLAEAANHRLGYQDVQAKEQTVWLARRLLEALDTIDKAKAMHFTSTNIHGPDGPYCGACVEPWPCRTWQALNGGNE